MNGLQRHTVLEEEFRSIMHLNSCQDFCKLPGEDKEYLVRIYNLYARKPARRLLDVVRYYEYWQDKEVLQ